MSGGDVQQLQNGSLLAEATGTLLGVRVGGWSRDALSSWVGPVLDGVQAGPFVFACANPHSLVVAGEDAEFRKALQRSTIVVTDGAGIRIGAFLAGQAVGPRITGFDFFELTMKCLNERDGHAYFFGSSDRVLVALSARLAKDFPRVRVTTWSPPFGNWSASENELMVEAVRTSGAHVLWVGLTAPKQEKWAIRNAGRLGVPLIGCIGAVFEYYAGTVVRAPRVWRALGLEWLYRLAKEPRRLWRRTLISAPVFLWRCLLQRWSR